MLMLFTCFLFCFAVIVLFLMCMCVVHVQVVLFWGFFEIGSYCIALAELELTT